MKRTTYNKRRPQTPRRKSSSPRRRPETPAPGRAWSPDENKEKPLQTKSPVSLKVMTDSELEIFINENVDTSDSTDNEIVDISTEEEINPLENCQTMAAGECMDIKDNPLIDIIADRINQSDNPKIMFDNVVETLK